ncbi:MAG: hypothetical protein ABR606_03315 [Vicinamibacterales bacterium]
MKAWINLGHLLLLGRVTVVDRLGTSQLDERVDHVRVVHRPATGQQDV